MESMWIHKLPLRVGQNRLSSNVIFSNLEIFCLCVVVFAFVFLWDFCVQMFEKTLLSIKNKKGREEVGGRKDDVLWLPGFGS